MGITEILLIGFGLAMDATAVSIGKGLSVKRVELSHVLKVGLWFGGFQALMPIVGYLLAKQFSDFVVGVDHWIAFGLLVLIGLNMIRECIWGDEEDINDDFGRATELFLSYADKCSDSQLYMNDAVEFAALYLAELADRHYEAALKKGADAHKKVANTVKILQVVDKLLATHPDYSSFHRDSNALHPKHLKVFRFRSL